MLSTEPFVTTLLANRTIPVLYPAMHPIVSRIWPLYRFRRVAFDAKRIGQPTAGAEGAAGTVQYWSLQPTRRVALPCGPIALSVKLSTGIFPTTARLQYRIAGEFREGLDFWVMLDQPCIRQRLIHLPKGIEELRLAVYTDDSGLTIQDVRMRELGKLHRAVSKGKAILVSILRNPKTIISRLGKAWAMYRRGGLRAIKERLFPSDRYAEWVRKYDTLTQVDREAIRSDIGQLSYKPKISVLLPVYNLPEQFLRAAIESVRNQIYTNWELCIADDNSPSPHVRAVIKEYAALDSRITFVFRAENGHIAEATNSAGALATGEFIGFLDHDDELREHALYMMIKELNAHPEADLIYSDEDKITEDGVRHYPHFKSDWNPELMLTQNFVCHFTLVRATVFRAVGGIRKGFDGAQDWDFVLRVSERTTRDRIRHIPHILYHWRVIEGSTAKGTTEKPYVTAAQIKAVSEHLERTGNSGARVASLRGLSMLRVHYRVPELPPLVSLIVPTYNQVSLLSTCVDGLLRITSYPNLEVLIVDNRSDDPETLSYLKKIAEDPRVRVIRDDGPFNFARLNNDAARNAKGSVLGFINNDIQVTRADWLDEMVANVVRPGIGAVGARLLYSNGTLQHAGVILGASGGVADHMLKHRSAHEIGYFCRAVLPQNLSAVTAACMLVTKEAFDRVGGFDEEAFAVAYNDIDFCLRLREAGYLNVYTPYAELIHHESISRGYEDTPEKRARFEGEVARMKARWEAALKADPYYNPNFSTDRADFRLGFPRRVANPWG